MVGGVRQVDHRAVERRDGEEEARPLLLRGLQQAAGIGAPGAQHGRRTHRVREREVVAQAVRVVELGRGERDVVLVDHEDLAGVRLTRVGDVVVQVNDALREAGRPAAEQPERRVVAVRVGGVGRRGRLGHQPLELRAGHGPRRKSLQQRVLGHDQLRVRVAGVVREVLRGVEERHRRGHGAGAHRPQEQGRERRRVVEDHQHPVLAAGAEFRHHAARAADAVVQLRVGHRLPGAADRDLVAVTRLEPAVDERPGVVHGARSYQVGTDPQTRRVAGARRVRVFTSSSPRGVRRNSGRKSPEANRRL